MDIKIDSLEELEFRDVETDELIMQFCDADDLEVTYHPQCTSSDTYTSYDPIKFQYSGEFSFTSEDCNINSAALFAMAYNVYEMSAETFFLYANQIVEMIMNGRSIVNMVKKISINASIPFKTFIPIVNQAERERLYRAGAIVDVMDYIKVAYSK